MHTSILYCHQPDIVGTVISTVIVIIWYPHRMALNDFQNKWLLYIITITGDFSISTFSMWAYYCNAHWNVHSNVHLIYWLAQQLCWGRLYHIKYCYPIEKNLDNRKFCFLYPNNTVVFAIVLAMKFIKLHYAGTIITISLKLDILFIFCWPSSVVRRMDNMHNKVIAMERTYVAKRYHLTALARMLLNMHVISEKWFDYLIWRKYVLSDLLLLTVTK